MPTTLQNEIQTRTKDASDQKPDCASVARDSVKVKASKQASRALRDVAEFLKLGAEPTRLDILLNLKLEPMNLASMVVRLKAPSLPALGHHFAMLRHGGIIEMNRAGVQANYNLTPKGIRLVEIAESFMDSAI